MEATGTEAETTTTENKEPMLELKEVPDTAEKLKAEIGRLLTFFITQANSIEKRLSERVQSRAVEQSAAMQRTEERIAEMGEGLKTTNRVVANVSDRLDGQERNIRDHQEAIGNLRELVNGAIATCKHLDDKAGDRFGKKLDALATQVAALTKIGERLSAAEKRAKDAEAAAHRAEAAFAEREADIDGLETRIESLEHKVADDALAAAEAEIDAAAEAKKE
jgi:chromosome segregation ATPase